MIRIDKLTLGDLMKQWYVELFAGYADKYDEETYTHGTIKEVDFIEQEIVFDKSIKILDIGCGTGRHSIELAKRGYKVRGIDLSESMLAKAREKAKTEGVKIDFEQADAREFNFKQEFDLAIMLCEGAFPLMETDEMNFKILENAYSSLSKKGKLIFTTLNGLFPLFHSVKDFVNSVTTAGTSAENSFDLMTFRDHSLYKITDDDGKTKQLKCNERYYVPPEISWLLKSIGFRKSKIYGCKLGAFSRNDKLTPDDYEMLVIAEK
jgi:2-polyprenyl-3-methyl-5-hydroxy-6-metoxy-1,4-benzoquinol methylase